MEINGEFGEVLKEELLREKLIISLKKEPINITHPPISGTLSLSKASTIAGIVIDIIKEAAGAPYKDGETEEITFGGQTWLLTLED